MSAFRFVTAVLSGPWRQDRREAVDDAIRSRQARENDARPDGIEWRVPGRIEERDR
jgi:hypothetical protein